MVSASQNIAACVLGTKNESSEHPDYYLSAGVYNGLMWHLIDPKYQTELVTLSSGKVNPAVS